MSEPAKNPALSLGPALLGALTLGLAPFVPEPHIVGKLRWVAGGAHGMAAMDWGDLLMHGAPWVWLAIVVATRVVSAARPAAAVEPPPPRG